MILADKIIRLRKQSGWSQEELAEKMRVSRQAVSKWESAQSVPDLEKILALAKLFGVTTDYLLKDELEDEELADESPAPVKLVSLALANEFIDWRRSAANYIALATFMCIAAVVPLILLSAMAEYGVLKISVNLAAGIGLVLLLIIVAIAVTIYILCGSRTAPYRFIEKEPFETEYGVDGMVREQQKAYRGRYTLYNILGTCLCILSPIPLFVGSFLENEYVMVVLLCLTMLIAGIGVVFFIIAGVRWASMEKLLKEGDYYPRDRRSQRIRETISRVYWLVATAIYLSWSFLTDDWKSSWIIWPIAGVLYAVVTCVCNLMIDREQQ